MASTIKLMLVSVQRSFASNGRVNWLCSAASGAICGLWVSTPALKFWSAPAPVFAALRRGLVSCSLQRRSRRRRRERSGDGALDFRCAPVLTQDSGPARAPLPYVFTVAAGILPAVEPGILPGGYPCGFRRQFLAQRYRSGPQDAALYDSQDGRRYTRAHHGKQIPASKAAWRLASRRTPKMGAACHKSNPTTRGFRSGVVTLLSRTQSCNLAGCT